MITEGTQIDASRVRYATSTDAIRKSGLIDTEPEKNPPLIWIDGLISQGEALSLLDYQRVNKIPGMDFLCYKSTLFSELNVMRGRYPDLYEFYPHTYLIPDELPDLHREHSFICGRTASAPVWVVKPRKGSCGLGIRFIQSMQDAEAITQPSVAQLLVDPFLLNDRKFDFRFFLLISSLEPFSAFIYKEGIARFCTQPYIVPTKTNLDHPFAHLTNTAINKQSDANPDDFTKLASDVLKEVIRRYPAASQVWDEIKQVSALTLAGLYPSILACLPMSESSRPKLIDARAPVITIPHARLYLRTANQYPFLGAVQRKRPMKKRRKAKGGKRQRARKVPELRPNLNLEPELEPEPEAEEVEEPAAPVDPKSRVLTPAQHYFHILGIDIILDSKGHPRLLELNDRPSLQVTAPFESELKEGVISEAFSHLSLDGSTFGNNEKSKWEQILPVSRKSGLAGSIQAIMQQRSGLKFREKAGATSSSTQRMLEAGIKPAIHELYRAKFIPSHLPPISSDDKDELM
jgi:hypothetical protein